MDHLNLKTIINISGVDFDFQILNVEDGVLKRFILGKHEYNIVEPKLSKYEKNTIKPEQKNIIKFCKEWSKEEEQILIDNYPKYTVKRIFELKLLPGRTLRSICDRSHRLHLKKYKGYNKKKTQDKININFNHKILSNKYHNRVYEQCFNHLVFKLEQKESFSNHDLRQLLKGWYKNALDQNLRKTNLENYVSSYRSYGIDQGFFEKIEPGVFKIPRIENKPVEILADYDQTSSNNYSKLVKIRSKEIQENKRVFEKNHKLDEEGD